MEIASYFDALTEFSSEKTSLSSDIIQYSDSIDLKEFDLAIMYVPENRWELQGISNVSEIFNQINLSIGNLYTHDCEPKILNLGIFKIGSEISDTEAGLSDVIQHLVRQRVIPIIIGGGRNLTYTAYKAFEKEEQIVNLTSVDNYLNLDESSANDYVGRIIKEQPNYLFNYSNVGFQTYFVSPEELELADELFFDAYRLGSVRGSVASIEPVVRNAEIVSCSLEVIKSSDFRSSANPQPNGMYAEEVCQIMKYAGLAEKNKVVLITDLNLSKVYSSDIMLIAEMVWCHIDGFYNRKSEIPTSNRDGFLKYRVPLRNDEFQLIFYKSFFTDRWWMEVPVPPQFANKYRKHHLIPCSYEDYLVATQDDLPERWWKAYKKML